MAAFSLEDTPKEPVMENKKETVGFDIDELRDFWYGTNDIRPKLITLIYGQDGTMKSGLVATYLTDEDIRAGKKMFIIDLDGGFANLLPIYYKKRVEDLGKKLEDVFVVKNPLIQNGITGEIDYKGTFRQLRAAIYLIRQDILQYKAVVLDGLTTVLSYAEQLMRIDKNITAEGGVNIAFWKIRNKHFIELLEQIKSLPIDSFLIGHENFILNDLQEDKNSSVMIKTGALVHQKIRMQKKFDKATNTTKFIATVDKSKNNVLTEDSTYELLVVDKNTKTFTLNTQQLFEDLK